MSHVPALDRVLINIGGVLHPTGLGQAFLKAHMGEGTEFIRVAAEVVDHRVASDTYRTERRGLRAILSQLPTSRERLRIRADRSDDTEYRTWRLNLEAAVKSFIEVLGRRTGFPRLKHEPLEPSAPAILALNRLICGTPIGESDISAAGERHVDLHLETFLKMHLRLMETPDDSRRLFMDQPPLALMSLFDYTSPSFEEPLTAHQIEVALRQLYNPFDGEKRVGGYPQTARDIVTVLEARGARALPVMRRAIDDKRVPLFSQLLVADALARHSDDQGGDADRIRTKLDQTPSFDQALVLAYALRFLGDAGFRALNQTLEAPNRVAAMAAVSALAYTREGEEVVLLAMSVPGSHLAREAFKLLIDHTNERYSTIPKDEKFLLPSPGQVSSVRGL